MTENVAEKTQVPPFLSKHGFKLFTVCSLRMHSQQNLNVSQHTLKTKIGSPYAHSVRPRVSSLTKAGNALA